MGYNANLVKAGVIPAKKGAAGVAVVYTAIPQSDQRVTIPFLRLKAGATGGNLAILQTENVYKFSLSLEGTVVSIPGISAGLVGRRVVIRLTSGVTKVTSIDAQSGETITLANPIEATIGGTLYLIATVAHESTALFALDVSGSTVLQGDCPGVIMGREIGWPVALYMVNTDGSSEIEGGTMAYIAV